MILQINSNNGMNAINFLSKFYINLITLYRVKSNRSKKISWDFVIN